MNYTKIISFILLALVMLPSCGKKNDINTDQKNNKEEKVTGNTGKEKIPDSNKKEILFNNEKFVLAWSSNPSDNYIKQEYIPEDQTLDKFSKMILMEVMTGNIDPKRAAMNRAAELKKMKESDPLINYDLFERNGEIMLDFILSQNMSGRSGSEIIERNVYRYKPYKDNSGKDGVLLFGVSERAYGDQLDKFLQDLKKSKLDLPNAVGSFIIPVENIP